jgi:hypothetical protein
MSLPALRTGGPGIADVPDDVLLSVFERCTPSSFLHREEYGGELEWVHPLAFSQVCRRWRNLALSHGALWSAPVFSMPFLAQETTRRAEAVLLDVRYNDWVSKDKEKRLSAIKYALRHHNRIRTLRLCVQEIDVCEDIINDLLTYNDHDCLESVLLQCYSGVGMVYERQRLAALLSSPFEWPRLRTLNINSACIMPDSPMFGNLTSLVIRGPFHSPGTWSLFDIHTVLRKAPHLKFLVISGLLDEDRVSQERISSSCDLIPLKDLHDYMQDDTMSVCDAVLQRLHMPVLQYIQVGLGPPDGASTSSLADFESLLRQLARCLRTAKWPPLQAISTGDISASPGGAVVDCTSYRKAAPADVATPEIVVKYWGSPVPRLADLITRTLPLSHILDYEQEIEEHSQPDLSLEESTVPFLRMPLMQIVRGSGQAAVARITSTLAYLYKSRTTLKVRDVYLEKANLDGPARGNHPLLEAPSAEPRTIIQTLSLIASYPHSEECYPIRRLVLRSTCQLQGLKIESAAQVMAFLGDPCPWIVVIENK